MPDIQADVRRIQAIDKATLETTIKTKQIGFETTTNKMGYKKSSGDMIYFPSDYSNAIFNNVTIDGIKTGYTQNLGCDANGRIIIYGGTGSEFIQVISGYLLSDANNIYKNIGDRSVDFSWTESGVLLNDIPFGGAVGTHSFASNFNTLASGIASHAEGSNTIANAFASHSEGDNTEAGRTIQLNNGSTIFSPPNLSACAHVEGSINLAFSSASHVEGMYNIAGMWVPNYTINGDPLDISNYIAELERLYSITYNDNYALPYLYNFDWSRIEGGLFYNGNLIVGGPYGPNAHVEGAENMALAANSHAEGFHNTIFPECFASHVEGELNIVGGVCSHIEGSQNTTSRLCSFNHIEGQYNFVNELSPYCHVEGELNIIEKQGTYSHVEGAFNLVGNVCEYSHIEGENNMIYKNSSFSHIEGGDNVIFKQCTNCHVEGGDNKIYNYSSFSHNEGTKNKIGTGCAESHIEGQSNIIHQAISHVEGNNNIGYGSTIHAEGYGNFSGTGKEQSIFDSGGNLVNPTGIFTAEIYTGYVAHSEGMNNVAGASITHAEGIHNIAGSISILTNIIYDEFGDPTTLTYPSGNLFGETSHVEGDSNQTLAHACHAEGIGTIAGTDDPDNTFDSIVLVKSNVFSTIDSPILIDNLSKGIGAHAEGIHTVARTNASHAEGIGNIITTTAPNGAHAEGSYCVPVISGQQSVIGIGDNVVFKNGLVMWTDGTIEAPESTTANMIARGPQTLVTIQYLIDKGLITIP